MASRKTAIILLLVLLLIVAIIVCAVFINTAYDAKNEQPTPTGAKEEVTEIDDGSKDAFSIGMNQNRDYLIMVNTENEYNFNGPYNVALQEDIIYASDVYGEPTPVEKGAYLAFTMLQQHLREQGMEIGLYSAYRTEEDQQWVYDYYGNMDDWSDTNTVLPPGYSEHHTGLMISFLIWWPDESQNQEPVWYEETAERQAMHPEFELIRNALADYGFIERYPAGKEDITGVVCEPYEIRFVGSSEIAHEIMDHNLCLEEYINNNDK